MKLPALPELLALRGPARALSLQAQGSARALLLGSRRGAQRGRGLEFEEVRPYVAGDDSRSIDWRVTARRGRPHTKLFREERERPVWLLVDLRPGMFFGSRAQLKSEVAVRAAALLAWVAALGGDRIGAVLCSATSTRCLQPRAREAGVLPILNCLLDLQPRAPAAPGGPSLNDAMGTLGSIAHPGSLILVLSDFADLDQASEARFSSVAAHSECRLFWITDALEQQGLPDGRFRGGLPGRLWSFDGAQVRARWLAAWRDRESRVRALSERLHLPITRLDTVHTVEQSLKLLLRASQFAA
jgi:uncharacterized protein (DUF58 family)